MSKSLSNWIMQVHINNISIWCQEKAKHTNKPVSTTHSTVPPITLYVTTLFKKKNYSNQIPVVHSYLQFTPEQLWVINGAIYLDAAKACLIISQFFWIISTVWWLSSFSTLKLDGFYGQALITKTAFIDNFGWVHFTARWKVVF